MLALNQQPIVARLRQHDDVRAVVIGRRSLLRRQAAHRVVQLGDNLFKDFARHAVDIINAPTARRHRRAAFYSKVVKNRQPVPNAVLGREQNFVAQRFFMRQKRV